MAADHARRVLLDAIAAGVFPSAVFDVGSSTGPLQQGHLGRRTFARESAPVAAGTCYDLASLTKPIATTTVVMDLVGRGTIGLDEPLAASFPEWHGADREPVTVRDLLEHSAGLPARLVDPPPPGRREFEHDICAMPLEYGPRTRSLYSDLGFILLGLLVERRTTTLLDATFDTVLQRLTSIDGTLATAPLSFRLDGDARLGAAPTRPLEDDLRRGRMLAGEVHDNYAAMLGGVAGHAGLFGTAAAVGGFAQLVLRAARGDGTVPPPLSPPQVAAMITQSAVPGSSRALGWDTMLPTSSCGTRMSAAAFGHVGFTGTSLWIDPLRDRYFVLLTNRACGDGTVEQMREVRRAFHDSLADL
ncbi:MAG: serine hydrolase domain-containing protein [Acidobacteriota bacterium]